MKKTKKNSELVLRIKRTKKKLKRLRLNKKYNSERLNAKRQFIINYENKVISNHKSNLYKFLIDTKFIVGTEEILNNIQIPLCFSLERNYNETVEVISQIVFSIWNKVGEKIEIDFSKCNEVDQSALFLLQILRLELQNEFEKLGNRLSVLKATVDINITRSTNKEVNLHLFLCGYISDVDVEDGVVPIDTFGYLKGSKQQKDYLENKKGINATRIVKYINKCLIRNNFMLNELGENDITSLIGEILSNAEDHSPFTTYYVTANYSQNETVNGTGKDIVGQLNLSFMNFGYSIYQGLEQTKDKNEDIYNMLNDTYDIISKKVPFSKDNLFTLYALQDGISRLKFEDKSRGTGTMKFINCFFSFGDYENIDKKQSPQLSILSGKTQVICDNKYKPFEEDNIYFVSLNDQKTLSEPPNKSHLKDLRYSFPGTLLSVRAYLNKDHISSKFEKNGNN